ncbi:hypothetical protein MRX96_027020 [Rhipicephalus microplus]
MRRYWRNLVQSRLTFVRRSLPRPGPRCEAKQLPLERCGVKGAKKEDPFVSASKRSVSGGGLILWAWRPSSTPLSSSKRRRHRLVRSAPRLLARWADEHPRAASRGYASCRTSIWPVPRHSFPVLSGLQG